MTRAALYARYSDPVQNPRSCEDQLALLTAHAVRKGWTVVATFADPEISGSAMANRPGLLSLIAAAEAGAFDVVLVEHQDRLARNLEHEAHVFNRLKARGVRIATLSTDQVTLMHVAVGGLMGELYLEVLSDKTRRGMHANAEKGLATGARIYGYASQPGGQMTIVPDQAEVVREIFDRYARGESLRTVTAALNARGVPSPSGGPWAPSTITGSRQRGNGVLRQELYVGVKVWNRFLIRRDRSTGRRTSTPVPAEQWKRAPAPQLRIVDQDVWDAVQARLTAAGDAMPAHRRTTPPHLLSGLIRCAACGAALTSFNSRGRLICAARRAHGPTACTNARSVPRALVEQRVLQGLRQRLLSTAAVKAYVRAYHAAWSAQQAASRDTIGPLERRAADLARQLERAADALIAAPTSATLAARLVQLEAEQAQVAADLAAARDNAPEPVTLHPRLAEAFAARIETLQAHLAQHGHRAQLGGAEASAETIATLRAMIDRIDVIDRADGSAEPVSIQLHGTLANFMTPQEKGPPVSRGAPRDGRLKKVVAGGGFKIDQTPALTIRIAC
jgi:site-specific DNA recombinase